KLCRLGGDVSDLGLARTIGYGRPGLGANLGESARGNVEREHRFRGMGNSGHADAAPTALASIKPRLPLDYSRHRGAPSCSKRGATQSRTLCPVDSGAAYSAGRDSRSARSGGLRPTWLAPARPEHRPAAASQRSLQACLAITVLLDVKDIPQVGP